MTNSDLVFTIDSDDISPERLEEYKQALNDLIGYDGKWTVEAHPAPTAADTPKPFAWVVIKEPGQTWSFCRKREEAEHTAHNLLTYARGCTSAQIEPLYLRPAAADTGLVEPTAYICDGCGRMTKDAEADLAKLRAAGALSCCPERHIVPLVAKAELAAAREQIAELERELAAANDLCERAELRVVAGRLYRADVAEQRVAELERELREARSNG